MFDWQGLLISLGMLAAIALGLAVVWSDELYSSWQDWQHRRRCARRGLSYRYTGKRQR